MSSVADILERIREYAPDADLQPVVTAYLLAARAHAGQVRKSGEPYLTHPLAVAAILVDMRMDVDTVATALLHDALEDNPITKREMAREIGPVITNLVDGVTKIGKLKFRSRKELAAENFRKMMLAMSKDLRVILVKLADRVHNMSTLDFHRPEKQRQIARETMDIYVPIANRLGLERIKVQLEEYCFKAVDREAYDTIHGWLDSTANDREAYIAKVVGALGADLENSGITAEVKGRAKAPWSIYKKTLQKGLPIQEIKDLLAFRVLVHTVGDCYAALGMVHAAYPPVADRIKDYVARPKPNGYQSLHTTVIGPAGRAVEIQLRTYEMNRVAEEGIAAHWRYKEGHLALAPEDVLAISRIRELFESAREAEDATEFMETVKVEFYSDEVFVFTPRGDVKSFPAGATALDFAYAVHTDVGQSCVGAKVNGRMVPIRYEMQSGDNVEILTSPTQKPSRDWLDFARTGRAVSKIRRFLRTAERDHGVRLGKEMVENELKRQGWAYQRLRTEGRLEEALKKRGFRDAEPMWVDIARGQLSLHAVVRDLLPEGAYQSPQELVQQNALSSLLNRIRPRSESPVLITGEDGVLVSFAKCCGPLPGEPIVGYITRGRGITVHRDDCTQLGSLDPERRISVGWDRQSDSRHTGEVQIYCDDSTGMLAKITALCERSDVNIQRVQAENIDNQRAVCTLQVAVRDVDELSTLIRSLRSLKGVEAVHRTVG
ncbi:MAG: guanosine-3',5'-bis(diphosphate) 3'-pyrophosphohydrolase [Myxococcota bacterium]